MESWLAGSPQFALTVFLDFGRIGRLEGVPLRGKFYLPALLPRPCREPDMDPFRGQKPHNLS